MSFGKSDTSLQIKNDEGCLRRHPLFYASNGYFGAFCLFYYVSKEFIEQGEYLFLAHSDIKTPIFNQLRSYYYEKNIPI